MGLPSKGSWISHGFTARRSRGPLCVRKSPLEKWPLLTRLVAVYLKRLPCRMFGLRSVQAIFDRLCRRSPQLLPPLLAVLHHLFRCRLGLLLVWAFDRWLAGNPGIDLDIWLKCL